MLVPETKISPDGAKEYGMPEIVTADPPGISIWEPII